MTPQVFEDINAEVVSYRQPSLTYRVNESTVSGKIDKLESVKQAIFHILSTERYSNVIYDENYGVELDQYIGKDFGYIEADIEKTIQDALLQDDRIKNVILNNIFVSGEQRNSCVAQFTVQTIYGEVEGEINVLQ